MRDRADMTFALVTALALHSVGGVAAGGYLVRRQLAPRPNFETGESSVELILTYPEERVQEVPPPPVEDKMPIVRQGPRGKLDPVEPKPDMAQPLLDEGVSREIMPGADIRPRYPRVSRERGEEGVVKVSIGVGKDGRADKCDILESSGHAALDREAVRACLAVRYLDTRGRLSSGGQVELFVRFELK